MRAFHHISTLPFLGCFVFSALVMNDDSLFLKMGSFNLSPWDALFLIIVGIKLLRLAEPHGYAMPNAHVGLLVSLHLITLAFLLCVQLRHTASEPGDVIRDFRVLLYFLTIPFLCYKDLTTHADYMTLQRFIIWSGIGVATWAIGEQLFVFSLSNPVRNLRIGIWVIPFSVVSLLYFQEQLGIKRKWAYMVTLFMMVALVFSLHRSQYLQLAVSVVLASLLGSRVGAMRKAVAIFVPALIGVSVVFIAIGYGDILMERFFSVNDLDNDSSYGARLQELEGQIQLYEEAPLLGHGAGLRSWVMGETGFELSTFAHNSWIFYLMKFGIIGTTLIFLPGLLILVISMMGRYRDPQLELHRRYLISCLPIYLLVDPLSGGLAYAPKTAFVGFLLCYCLSVIRNGHSVPAPQPLPAFVNPGIPRTPSIPHHG